MQDAAACADRRRARCRTRARVEGHVEGCARLCRGAASHSRSLRRAIAAADLRLQPHRRICAPPCPHGLPRRHQRLRRGRAAVRLLTGLPPGAVCFGRDRGSLALIVMRRSDEDRMLGDIVSAHLRSLQAEHLTDVQSSNQHTVKPWFNGRLDVAPPVPDLTAQGFTLIGGRLDYIDGKSVAAIVYRRRIHVINLFVAPGAGAPQHAARPEHRAGFQHPGLDRSATSISGRSAISMPTNCRNSIANSRSLSQRPEPMSLRAPLRHSARAAPAFQRRPQPAIEAEAIAWAPMMQSP